MERASSAGGIEEKIPTPDGNTPDGNTLTDSAKKDEDPDAVIHQMVEEWFVKCDKNEDGKLDIAEAKPYI